MPSEIIREHFKFTTQPMDDMTRDELMNYMDMMGSDEMICFSTDYPHWDYDNPHTALPGGLSEDVLEKIRSEEHTSELQSRGHLVCRLLLEKKKQMIIRYDI